jgi:hypothetical protein
MTHGRWWVACVVVLVAGTLALAQAPAGPPKPGPEHKRLGVFAGKWTGSGDMKAGPWGPGGKMTWTETCEWFAGGFSMVCHSDSKGPMGEGKGLFILGYNTEEKKYVYFGIESAMGNPDTSKGTVQGKTWNWTGEGMMNGKMVKSKFTIIEQSNDVHTFKGESSVDGGPWSVTMEGKTTRAK